VPISYDLYAYVVFFCRIQRLFEHVIVGFVTTKIERSGLLAGWDLNPPVSAYALADAVTLKSSFFV
jgi:hypothetical protein